MEFFYGMNPFHFYSIFFMGNNLTKFFHSSTCDPGTNSFNTDIHLDSNLILSEEEILLYVQKLILNDEILSEIVRRHCGTRKVLRAKHRRQSNVKLWNTSWGGAHVRNQIRITRKWWCGK